MKPKVYNVYQIVDIDTGELLKNINNKYYTTVATEKKYRREYKTEIRGNYREIINYTIATTTRIVKHNGQTRIDI